MTVASPSATGFRRGSHRNSNGFVGFACTQLQEAVVILGVLHSTQWTRYDHRFPAVSTSRSVQIFNHGLIRFAFCLSKYCHIWRSIPVRFAADFCVI